MAATRDSRRVFSYSVPVSSPMLECRFGLDSSLGDDLTTETLPVYQEIIEENGNTLSVTKCSSFLVERGDVFQELQGIASLRWRLFNEGIPMMVLWRLFRFHYRVDERTIERYLWRVAGNIFREPNSHAQSRVFRATFRCDFSVADVEAFWLNEDAQILQVSMESPAFRASPATQEAVDGLEKTKIGEGLSFDSRDCSICLEELSSDAEHICMPCKHVYHKDCIVTWLKMNHICPLCRFSLPHD